MTIIELKAIIDRLAELHPDASVDVSYPVMFRGVPRSRPGRITGYQIYGADSLLPTARLILNHARTDHVIAGDGDTA